MYAPEPVSQNLCNAFIINYLVRIYAESLQVNIYYNHIDSFTPNLNTPFY